MTANLSIGLIGTGNMGLPMVTNLVADGFDVAAFDPDPEALEDAADEGADAVESPAAVGARSDVVFLVVPTDDHVREACTGDDGVFEDMDEGVVVINSSTTPSLPAEIQSLSPDGVRIVDAPMCRGAAAARAGNILFLVGGDEESVERCRPALSTSGEVEYLGGLGAGQVGKTANNLLLWITIVGDYEVLRLAENLDVDIDPLKLREVLPLSSGDNWAIREGNWESLRLTWPEKDLAIALDLADEADSPIPVAALTSQLIKNLDVPDLEPYYLE